MSLQSTLGISFPVKIKLLTPVHIGNGDTLSPYADYVLDGKKNVCLINADILAGELYEKQQINTYVKTVIATEKDSKELVLSRFVQHNMGSDINYFMTGEILPGHGIENPILIDRCITTDGDAYIPASSIKGAIRSALLHNWLCSGSADSKNALKSFIQSLQEFTRRSDYSTSKKITEIEKKFGLLVEDIFFGSIKQKERLPMSCFRLVDTGTCTFAQRAAYQAERINLVTGESSKYNIKECISPGTDFTTTISIDFYRAQQYHPVLEAVNSKAGLFNILYQYSLDNLEHEWMLLGMIPEAIQQKAVKPYDTFVSSLKQQVESADESTSFLRLGAGKMQLYQTIGNALYKYTGNDDNHPDWCLYLDYLAKFNEVDRTVYPVTRIFCAGTQMPFGWAELS